MELIYPPYFKAEEFACKCGCGRADMQQDFLDLIGQLRVSMNEPLVITSGFRCNNYNMKIKGAPDSQHMKGRAVDISCAESAKRFRIISSALRLGFSGIGVDGAFIHLDNRPSGRLIFVYPSHG